MRPDAHSDSARARGGGAGSPRLIGRVREAVAQALAVDHSELHQQGLIATLHEVADALSTARCVEDVLQAIVDRAKSITNTDKAVLLLTDDHDANLDLATMVVRGARVQHSQQWWESAIEALAGEAFKAGEPVIEEHADAGAVILASPVRVRDRDVGLLGAINSIDKPFTQEQIEYTAILSAFAAAAIENAQMAEEARYVMLASERERIASEMHDGVVQSLFSISLGLELCKRQVYRDPTAVSSRLEELQGSLNRAMTELRRYIYDLRPIRLAELGLVGAVELWVSEVTLGRDIRGGVTVDGELPRLTPSQESCLYRVAKEAVTNAVRHSNGSTFEVRIVSGDDNVRLVVADDGDGFDERLAETEETHGFGLRSIRDRLEREGGTMGIERADGVTSILADLPVGRPA
jgi:signal transduction histidine kinase